MRQSIMQHKPLAIGAVALVALLVVLIVASAALIKPGIGHAAPPEFPAVQFGPILVQPGQIANLGVINWGDKTVHIVMGIVSANNTSSILAHKEQDVAPGTSLALPFSNVAGGPTAPVGPISVGGIVAVRSLGNDWQSSFRSLGTALEVADGTSNTNRAFVPPVALPAVQIPSELATGTAP